MPRPVRPMRKGFGGVVARRELRDAGARRSGLNRCTPTDKMNFGAQLGRCRRACRRPGKILGFSLPLRRSRYARPIIRVIGVAGPSMAESTEDHATKGFVVPAGGGKQF